MHLLVDDEDVAVVRSGESVSVETTAGPHTIQLVVSGDEHRDGLSHVLGKAPPWTEFRTHYTDQVRVHIREDGCEVRVWTTAVTERGCLTLGVLVLISPLLVVLQMLPILGPKILGALDRSWLGGSEMMPLEIQMRCP
ncbi:MAG: hypothetical protein O3C25_03120 [Chloroflexi bacterium]|nr:hypothetical protein [Chloroflexota bacterium]